MTGKTAHRIFAIWLTFSSLAAAQESRTPHAPTRPAVEPSTPTPPPEGQTPVGAAAQLKPTQGQQASGTLTLGPEEDEVRITGALQGLRPNAEHALHIHEKGDCSATDASSAGEHFNPTGQPHGRPDGSRKHAGDLLNIKANAQGVAHVDMRVPSVTLRTGAKDDVYERAVVVHEQADDYHSQPAGNSGKRIACGVIE